MGAAEDDALLRVVDRAGERGASDPHGLDAREDPPPVQRVEEVVETRDWDRRTA
jgi:hypothetical protein